MEKSNPGAAACLAIFAQTLSETERQKLRENCELLFRLLGGEGAAEPDEPDDNEVVWPRLGGAGAFLGPLT